MRSAGDSVIAAEREVADVAGFGDCGVEVGEGLRVAGWYWRGGGVGGEGAVGLECGGCVRCWDKLVDSR